MCKHTHKHVHMYIYIYVYIYISLSLSQDANVYPSHASNPGHPLLTLWRLGSPSSRSFGQAAVQEIKLFFPDMGVDPLPDDHEVRDFLFRTLPGRRGFHRAREGHDGPCGWIKRNFFVWRMGWLCSVGSENSDESGIFDPICWGGSRIIAGSMSRQDHPMFLASSIFHLWRPRQIRQSLHGFVDAVRCADNGLYSGSYLPTAGVQQSHRPMPLGTKGFFF